MGEDESQASPARLELLFQDAVLFDQVGDHDRLLTADPAGERGQEELQVDGVNHAVSVSDPQQVVALQHDRVFGHCEVVVYCAASLTAAI